MKAFTLISAMVCTVALALPAPFYITPSHAEIREAIPYRPEITAPLQNRQTCAETCGTICYNQTTINKAAAAGYKLYQQKKEKGDYPHLYNNYEGFDFGVSGPYQEYPIMSDFIVYSGGSPGPDRVIFNTKGALVGTLTHTGASGNDFVECEG